MGAMNSIHQKLKEFSDTEEGSDYVEGSTPQKMYRQKCISNIDPRSPTENIDRTPIIVDGTPITHLSKGEKSRFGILNNGPVDPRSPSTDFTRTPLSIGPTCSGLCDTPLRATDFESESAHNEDLASLSELTTDKAFGEVLGAAFETSTPTNRPHSNSTVSTDSNVTDESFDTAPLLESTEKLTISSSKECGSDETTSLQTKLKCRSVNRVLNQHVSVLKPRSPLSLVENSPRLSNVKKVITGDKSDYVTLSNSAVDKENMCR